MSIDKIEKKSIKDSRPNILQSKEWKPNLIQWTNDQISLNFCNAECTIRGGGEKREGKKKYTVEVQPLLIWMHAPLHYDGDGETHRMLPRKAIFEVSMVPHAPPKEAFKI